MIAVRYNYRGYQVRADRGEGHLFPADELGRCRQLVLIADIRWVAAEEVEIDKSRVVRTI